MEKWIIYIFLATILFVIGQLLLKTDKNESLIIVCYFTISMGLLGLFCLLYIYNTNKNKIIFSQYAILAGILFFFGNFLWILSIKNSPSISLVRVIMAGGETALLLIFGYLLFQENSFSFKNIIGIILILCGVYSISK